MTASDGSTTSQRKVGRPKTGRSTQVVSVRLRMNRYQALVRKAKSGGHYSVGEYLHFLIHRELYRHYGEGTRRRLERERQAWLASR